MGKIVVKQGQFFRSCELGDDCPLTIGRGYGNTLIINDPFVAASQLRITAHGDSNDSWSLLNLDDTNPVLVNRREIESDAVIVHSGDEVTIGRSSLAFFSPEHRVAPTRSFTIANWLQNYRFKPLLAALMLGLVFGLSLLMTWLWDFHAPDWGELTAMSAVVPIVVVLWSGAWALSGRFLKHQHHFSAHLFFSAVSVCLLLLAGFASSYVDYFFSSTLAGQIFDWSTGVVIIGLAIGFNISLATHSPRAMRKGMLASICLYGLSLSLIHMGQNEYSNKPAPSASYKPAWAPVANTVSVEEHISHYDDLMTALARQDREE